MSKNTFFNTRFWQDSFVADLDPSEKLLFIYCLTCPYLSLTGIYEIPLKYLAIETGLDKEMVIKILRRFEEKNKIIYREGWLCVINYPKYQRYKGEKLVKALENEIKAVPKDILKEMIGYGYPIDTLSIPSMGMERERERERDMEKGKELVEEKTTHGQFNNVFLTEKEYNQLIENLNQEVVATLIEELSGYMESTGKKYKSHYATLQNWARRRINEYADKNRPKPKSNAIAEI